MVSRWGGALSGAAGGALAGGAAGAPISGIGAIPGAIGGGLLGGIAGYFGAEPDEYKQLTNQSEGQQNLQGMLESQLQPGGASNQNYQQAQSYLSSLLSRDPQAYEQFSQPYLDQFNQNILPGIASRSGQLGGPMGGRSSTYDQLATGAGANLQAQLAQLYSGRQQQAAGQAFGQYNQDVGNVLGQRPFENIYQRGTTGIGGSLLETGLGQLQSRNQVGMLQQLIEQLSRQSQPQEQRSGIDQQ